MPSSESAQLSALVAPAALMRQASGVPKVPDIQVVFKRHLSYMQKRDRAYEKAAKLDAAGDHEGAARALNKAYKFDLMRRSLQPDPNFDWPPKR
jgi:hypothetical protein